ncbi:MAG: ORF6N domain-containing protein [Planctomycetes bacterium]|nr:ORF6N domain-containing protein [Planctomycetota bacterium]
MTPEMAIESRIFIIRSHRVMFDSDLALLYGVTTKRLNQQVRRNLKRFPADFGFQLTWKEIRILRSQNATSSWGGRRTQPWVFTEHGALMLSSVLSSRAALQASIQVVRAFVRLRELLADHRELSRRLDALEARFHGQFRTVFDAIRRLMEVPPERPTRRIGFHAGR